MAENPISTLLKGALSPLDFAVMQHGFAEHGRDYISIIGDALCEDPGTYQLTFAHVVDLNYGTRMRDDVWLRSWTDEFIDFDAWRAAGEPDGYVFGTNWSLAYPGTTLPDASLEAEDWSRRLCRPMHAVGIETNRFTISLIFSYARLRKLSVEAPSVRRVLRPLDPEPWSNASAARVGQASDQPPPSEPGTAP